MLVRADLSKEKETRRKISEIQGIGIAPTHIVLERNAQLSPITQNLVPVAIIPTIEFLLSEEVNCINEQNISITCGR